MPGNKKCITIISIIVTGTEVPAAIIASYAENCPTRPEEPIPDPAGVLTIFSNAEDTGPKTALVSMGGSHIHGLLIILGICSMEVPNPWAIKPPVLFSLKLAAANPII